MNTGARNILISLAIIVIVSITGVYIYNTFYRDQPQNPPIRNGTYIVMISDPPHPLDGTTDLRGSVEGLSLHISYPNGTSRWVTAATDFELDMLALINKKQTFASLTMPYGSIVAQVRFRLTNVTNTINGQEHAVTSIARQLQLNVHGAKPLNESRSGVLIDLHPSVFLTQLTNTTVGTARAYIMAPDTTTVYLPGVDEAQSVIGSWTFIKPVEVDVVNAASKVAADSVSLTSATLRINGTKSSFTLSLKNNGQRNTTIFGVVLSGLYNTSVRAGVGFSAVVPFRVSGSSMNPIFNEDGSNAIDDDAPKILRPGEAITLAFSGELTGRLTSSSLGGQAPITFTPVLGRIFIFRVISEATNQDLRYQVLVEES